LGRDAGKGEEAIVWIRSFTKQTTLDEFLFSVFKTAIVSCAQPLLVSPGGTT
jgi:hypothetical protein